MMTTLIQQHLTRAQKRMKTQADKSRSEGCTSSCSHMSKRLWPRALTKSLPSNSLVPFRYRSELALSPTS
jgi:hypothetical protein